MERKGFHDSVVVVVGFSFDWRGGGNVVQCVCAPCLLRIHFISDFPFSFLLFNVGKKEKRSVCVCVCVYVCLIPI